jgi:hypothetical protein
MAVNLKPYEFAQTPGNPFRVLKHASHYLRLTGPERGEILYIQGGHVHAENGPPLTTDEIPEWFHEAVMGCTRPALEAVGWAGPYPEEPVRAARRRESR